MSWGQDPNPYGDPLRDLLDASAQAISSKLSAIGSAASVAKDKVVSLAQSAAEATAASGKKLAAGAFVGAEGAVTATVAVTGHAGYQTVVKPVAGAVGAVQKAAAAVKERFSPQRTALVTNWASPMRWPAACRRSARTSFSD